MWDQVKTPKTGFLTTRLIWDDSKTDLFHAQLVNSHEVIQRLISDLNTKPIEHMVQHFTRFLHDSAFVVFGKTTSSKSHSTKQVNKNNEWFDENCQKAKQDFKNARNNFNRMKTDETRLSFTCARTGFNRTKQKAKKKFKIKEGNQINSLAKKQPQEFWKNIKATYWKPRENANSQTLDNLHDYFKSLFGEAPTGHHFDENTFNETQSNDELDSSFT